MELEFEIEALYAGVRLEAGRESAEHQLDVVVLGAIEAYLVDPKGDMIEAAALEWTRDGSPVTQGDLSNVPTAILPAALDEDGRLVAVDLPLARYCVKAVGTPAEGEAAAPDYAAVQLPWVANNRELGTPHIQRVRYAERPTHETESSDQPEDETVKGCLHVAFVDRRGKVLTGLDCSWQVNGSPYTGSLLPAALPDDGVVKVEDLVGGQYVVQLEPPAGDGEAAGGDGEAEAGDGEAEAGGGDDAPRYQPVRVAWTETLGDAPTYQRVRLA